METTGVGGGGGGGMGGNGVGCSGGISTSGIATDQSCESTLRIGELSGSLDSLDKNPDIIPQGNFLLLYICTHILICT